MSGNIIPTDLRNEMSQSYLEYAMSVIVGRALPDARDGLKPVHRRILYAMHELGMGPDRPYRKCARVVGDVIGKYHPHGDTAVYDALVRMAQDFSMRERLVDGHGNFGSIDNDPPAAMRYTECRLTAFSRDGLLQDIETDTVDFGDNYDGSQQEPLVLPARMPQLLLNGSSGIAVGMATNSPPHNLSELVDALVALVENPELSSLELMQYVPGPDFPTGALILGKRGIRDAYTTGRGSVTMRGVATVETFRRGNTEREAIIITALPYQTNKASMIEKIAEMVNDKRLEGISDIRDESDRDGMRVVIELKRDAYAQVVLNNLYKQTPLQSNFGVNMLAIVEGEPRTLNLKDSLQVFLDFREEVIERRTRFKLRKAEERDHILVGLLRALSNIDRIIALIRGAADAPTAKAGLQEEFELSEAQSDAILQMQLRRLTGLEADKIQAEHDDLTIQIADFKDILNRRERVLGIVTEELQGIKDKFGEERATQICLDDGDIDDADLIENREIVVFVTSQGYVKRLDIEEFEVQGRATRGKAGTRMKDDDAVEHFFACRSHDTILFFSDRGVAYKRRGYQLPRGSRTSRGTPLLQFLPIGQEEKITSLVPVSEFTDDEYLVMLTRGGYVKKTALSAFANVRSNGLIAISLEDGDELRWVRRARPEDDLIVGTQKGMAIRFNTGDQLRPLGRATRGVRSMTLRDGDVLVSMDIVCAEAISSAEVEEGEGFAGPWVLVLTSTGYGKRTPISGFRVQNRGGKGLMATKFRTEDQELSSLRIVNADDEVMIVTARGIVIRQRAGAITNQSRMGTGVRVQRLDDDDSLCAVTIVPAAIAESDADEDGSTDAGEGIDIAVEVVEAGDEVVADSSSEDAEA